jgi:hypothetical protein
MAFSHPQMLWTPKERYDYWAFETEADLEAVIKEVEADLFGDLRYFIDTKKLVGQRGKTQNIPDAYLLDLSGSDPGLYVAEVELATHDPIRHVTQQLLNFARSFASTPLRMKDIIREEITADKELLIACEEYAQQNGLNNLDVLLDQLFRADNAPILKPGRGLENSHFTSPGRQSLSGPLN